MHATEALPSLPPATALEIVQSLRNSLPPPVTDTPASFIARDNTAIEILADMHPVGAFEARLAVQIVAADAQAGECLRLIGLPDQDPAVRLRCRAQAAAMLRLMQSGTRILQRTQEVREKAEAAMQPAAMQRAGWYFRDASVPLPDAPPDPADAEPVIDLAAEAERYAVIYPDRAARIRAAGGLPARCEFGPPDDDLVAAIVNGTSPALLEADRRPVRTAVGR
jgi:hypothetical protein